MKRITRLLILALVISLLSVTAGAKEVKPAISNSGNITTMESGETLSGEVDSLTWSYADGKLSLGGLTIISRNAIATFDDDVSALGIDLQSVSKLEFLEGVQTIDDYALEQFEGLKCIVFPKSIVSIGDWIFADIPFVSEMYFKGNAPAIAKPTGEIYGCGAFGDVTATVYVPSGNKTWNGAARQNYGGTLTWKEWNPETGEISETADISGCAISLSKTSFTYDGKEKKPTVTVKNGAKTLKLDTDYKVSYSNNTNAGTGKVVIAGIGSYTGTVEKKLTISKATTKITASNVIRGQQATQQTFTLSTKVNSGVKPTFTSNNKSITVNKTTSKVTVQKGYAGKATITITAADSKNYKKATKKITVTIKAPELNYSSAEMYKKESFTLKYT